MVVAQAQDDLVQVPERRRAQSVLQLGVVSRSGDSGVLVGVFRDGETVVQIDPEIADVEIE